MSLVDTAFECGTHLLFGEHQSPTVGVMDDGKLLERKEVIYDQDFPKRVTNVAAPVPNDGDFSDCQVEKLFRDASRVHACH